VWPHNAVIKIQRDEAEHKAKALELLAAAKRQLAQSKTAEAVKLLEEALALDPSNAQLKDILLLLLLLLLL
jgi:Flp pilus assembly protein TadD